MEQFMYNICSGTIIMAGLFIFFIGLRVWFRERVVVKARTIPINKVRFGKTAVQGTVEKPRGHLLRAPISRKPGVFYRTKVRQHIFISESREIIRDVYERIMFTGLIINDGTKRIKIVPDKVEVRLKKTIDKDIWFMNKTFPGFWEFVEREGLKKKIIKPNLSVRYKVIEEVLEVGKEVLIIGHAEKRSEPLEDMDSPYLIKSGIGPKDLLLISDTLAGRISSKGKREIILSLVIGTMVILLGGFILVVRFI